MIIEARDDTITLRGEVKSNIWPAIQAAAALLLDNHPTGIIIDCSALTRITSRGALTFQDAFAFIASQNARIVVVGLTEEMLAIGRTVPGFRSQLPIASSVEEARRSLQLSETTLKRGTARAAGVVPILGNWRRAIFFADQLAIGENCEIHLVDLIRVPRTLPIGTPMPEREAEGQARLVEAQQLVKQTKLKSFSHVERVRSESGLDDFAQRLGADFTVVSLDPGGKDEPHIERDEALSLQETAALEVSLIKGGAEAARIPAKIAVPALGAWEHAVEHACKLATGQRSEVTVIYTIAIPRAEPLDAKRPDAEAAAADCAREAARIGRGYGMKVATAVERVRDPVLGFIRIVQSGGYDLAVVGTRHGTVDSTARDIAVALLDELPCETIFLSTTEAPTV